MNFYLLTQHGAINDQDGICAGSIRSALQFKSFEAADEFAKTIPALRREWYHIVCDAFPSGTYKLEESA